MERLRIFLDHGLGGLIQSLIHYPPHAAYPTLAAFFAFLLAGPNIAGPYVMNGVTVALLLALLFRSFRVSALTTWAMLIVLVTTLWFDYAVTSFHPDLVAGFAAAIVAAVLIWQSEIVPNRLRAIQFGIIAGIVLLIKPTAVAMVIALWAVAFLIGGVVAYLDEKSLRQVGARLLFGGMPVLIIAGPYFAHDIAGLLAFNYQPFLL